MLKIRTALLLLSDHMNDEALVCYWKSVCSVQFCDFLSVELADETVIHERNHKTEVLSLEKSSYHVVIFCLLLEYLPRCFVNPIPFTTCMITVQNSACKRLRKQLVLWRKGVSSVLSPLTPAIRCPIACFVYLKCSCLCENMRCWTIILTVLLFQARNSEQLSSWKLGLGLLGLAKVGSCLWCVSWDGFSPTDPSWSHNPDETQLVVMNSWFRWPTPRQSISMVLFTGTLSVCNSISQAVFFKLALNPWNN